MRPALSLAVVIACFSTTMAAQGAKVEFEVASVRPNDAGPGALQRVMVQPGDRVSFVNVPLRIIIQESFRPDASEIVGLPFWAENERFNVDARAPAQTSVETLRLMLQSLLKDRFSLAVHVETRSEKVFALVKARSDGKPGPNLRAAAADCAKLREGRNPRLNPCGLGGSPTGHYVVRGMDAAYLASLLGRDAGRRVIDKTGFTGPLDFDLTYTPTSFLMTPFDRSRWPTIDPDGPSVHVAVQEQLGLKFVDDESTRNVLIVDGIGRLKEN